MRNAKLFGIFVVLLMLTIGVSGCINQEPTDVQDEMTENPEDGVNGKTTQLPNPAAVYCERDKGGVHQSVETELGIASHTRHKILIQALPEYRNATHVSFITPSLSLDIGSHSIRSNTIQWIGSW